MASLNMTGAFPLTRESIDREIKKERIGNYALGYRKEKTFYVQYVGRSDDDLNDRLKVWAREGDYAHFYYSYAVSVSEAYHRECKNYHDFGGPEGKLDNEYHPDSPDGLGLKCRLCQS